MGKKVAIITYDIVAAQFYAHQLHQLFGDLIETSCHSVLDGTATHIPPSDLYLPSADSLEGIADYESLIPPGGRRVDIGLTFTLEALKRIRAIPKGTRVLFVNLSEIMVREAIARLSQMGFKQIDFFPFYPGSPPVSGFDVAVTPGEAEHVPSSVKTIIDLGHRVLDSNTIVEIALKLKMDFLLEEERFQDYFQSIADNLYSFDEVFSRSTRQQSRFEILIELLDEGIIGVSDEHLVFACNHQAGDITGVDRRRALEQPAADLFPYIPFEECRRTRLRIDTKLVKLRDVALNVTVTPVMRGEKYLGAFAMIQRFSEQESKQHKLRAQLLNKGHEARYTFHDIIGKSPAIHNAVSIATKMAKANSSVLIIGESGTGKELFAHAIHNISPRKTYPFVAINCAAIPDNLLESELFGYEDGAFTGGKKGGKPGLFEFAHRGSIFLDEVEGMSPALQVKLLRVIQEQEVMRVGGNKIIRIDVRVIAASNERLEALVTAGSFRKDLYFRLNTLPIHLPALRERGEDIMILFNHFKRQLSARFQLDSLAERALLEHNWSGNIRELRNVAEYLTCIDKPLVTSADLPPGFHALGSASADRSGAPSRPDAASTLSPHQLFVLHCLNQGRMENVSVGRDRILAQAEKSGVPLTQQSVRSILTHLDAMGLVQVVRGRGGSRITPQGIAKLEE